MMQLSITSKMIINAGLILLTLVFGIILHKTGRPYNSALFTIHKLATVGFVIFTIVTVLSYAGQNKYGLAFIVLLCLAIFSMLALFVSGALMSLGRQNVMLSFVHKAATITFVSCITGMFFKILNIIK